MAMSVLLLASFCRWGLEGAAASRLAYGVAWVALYARFLHQVIRFDVRRLLLIYLKSGLAASAAVAPLVLVYLFWVGPAIITLPILLPTVGAGVALWMVALMLLRHPAFADLTGLASHVLAPLRRAVARG